MTMSIALLYLCTIFSKSIIKSFVFIVVFMVNRKLPGSYLVFLGKKSAARLNLVSTSDAIKYLLFVPCLSKNVIEHL